MLKRIREILAVALLALVFGAGMAVVLCVGALAVWYTLGKTASILAFAAACLGLVVLALLALATKVTPSYSGEAKGSGSGSRVESAAEKIIQCEEGRQELCQIGDRRCVHTISENERWRSAARGCGWVSAPASFLDQRKRSGSGSGISAEDLTITYALMRG